MSATFAVRNPPLVSIIIPCWNGEAFVGEAIDSALNQTYPHLEVIVVDDGSTDGSLDVVRSFGKRVRWQTGPNRGACTARNRGLALARGEVIQFLDCDDLLHPAKFARQLPLLAGDAEVIAYCGQETFELGRPERRWVDSPTHDSDDIVFAVTKIIHTECPLYRREQLQAVGGYRTALPCAQDYDLHLRLALRGCRFRKLDEILVTVRRRGSSVSSDSLKVLREMREIWRELRRELGARGQLTPERRQAIAARMAGAARAFARHGDLATAESLLQEARAVDCRGVRKAYGGAAWWMSAICGPLVTEQAVALKRRLTDRSGRPL